MLVAVEYQSTDIVWVIVRMAVWVSIDDPAVGYPVDKFPRYDSTCVRK
jgi:hypothetical protein